MESLKSPRPSSMSLMDRNSTNSCLDSWSVPLVNLTNVSVRFHLPVFFEQYANGERTVLPVVTPYFPRSFEPIVTDYDDNIWFTSFAQLALKTFLLFLFLVILGLFECYLCLRKFLNQQPAFYVTFNNLLELFTTVIISETMILTTCFARVVKNEIVSLYFQLFHSLFSYTSL